MAKIIKYLKVIAKLLLTAIALYIVFKKIDVHQVFKVLSGSNYLLLGLAFLFFVVSKLISSIRLNMFLKCIGIKISEKLNMQLYLLGMYYNLFLPGGIGGDGYKIYFLNRKLNISVKELFWSLLLDRVMGLLALLCLAGSLFFFTHQALSYRALALLCIPVSLAAFYYFLKLFHQKYLQIFTASNLLSFLVQISQLVCAYFILWSVGNSTGTIDYLFLFLISSIVATIPFTIGGAGSRELTLLLGAQWLHLNVNLAVSLSIAFYLITAITSLFGIYYSFSPLRFNEQ